MSTPGKDFLTKFIRSIKIIATLHVILLKRFDNLVIDIVKNSMKSDNLLIAASKAGCL